MKNADEAKRHVFVEYVHLFQKKAKTDFILNQIVVMKLILISGGMIGSSLN